MMVHAGRPIPPVEKSRELQRKLYLAAKRNRKRKFHALYDRIYWPDVLWRAWKKYAEMRVRVLLPTRKMWCINSKEPGRRMSESRMMEYRGTHADFEQEAVWREAWFVRLSEGKIVEDWTVFDGSSYFRQLGYQLVPPST